MGGIVLCELVNVLRPGVCKAPSKMNAPFKQMENIGNYLAACTALGMPVNDSFQTVTLYENKDMMQVIVQIHSLGRIAQSIGYVGPTLGVKLAEKNERTFTEQQLVEAASVPTFLGKGSHGTPGGAMSKADASRQIDKMSKVEGHMEGLGIGGETTMLNAGSAGTAGAAMSKVNAGRDINKMANVQ